LKSYQDLSLRGYFKLLVIKTLNTLAKVTSINIKKICFLIVASAMCELINLITFGITVSSLLSNPPLFGSTFEILIRLEYIFRQKEAVSQALIFLFIFLITNGFLILATWKISQNSAKIGNGIADRIFQMTITAPWERMRSYNEAEILSSATSQVVRLTNGVITPAFLFLLKLSHAIIIGSFIVFAEPILASQALLFLCGIYLLLYLILKPRVTSLGKVVTSKLQARQEDLLRSLGLSREVRTYGLQDQYLQRFQQNGRLLSAAQGAIGAFSIIPRYLVELVVFGSFVGLLTLMTSLDTNQILVKFSILGFSFFRLMPSIQYLFSASTMIKGNITAMDVVKEIPLNVMPFTNSKVKNHVNDSLMFENISYKLANVNILNDLTFSLPKTGLVIIKGESGSGKSTLSEIICGLRVNTKGVISDSSGQSYAADDLQKLFCLIPQRPFVDDYTVLDNIFLNTKFPNDGSKLNMVKKLLVDTGLVHSHEEVTGFLQLQCSRLSGGQIQRIAIIRALLQRKQKIILDEPTSALDSVSEKRIVELINTLKQSHLVILVTHSDTFDMMANLKIYLSNGKVKNA
jgi:ATP-binding cassette, subfamily B, bacterial PglK